MPTKLQSLPAEDKVIQRDGEPFTFLVRSDRTDERYLCDIQAWGFSGQCNCMNFLTRLEPKVGSGVRGPTVRCKHLRAAREHFLEFILPKLAEAMGMTEPDLDLNPSEAGTEYGRARRLFLLKHRKCAVFPHLASSEIHHSRGRLGPLLMDQRFWVPVSRLGHQWIDSNRDLSRERIWHGIPLLCARGDWNRSG